VRRVLILAAVLLTGSLSPAQAEDRADRDIRAPATWLSTACEAWRNALDDRVRVLSDLTLLEPSAALAVREEIDRLVVRCRSADPGLTLWRFSLLADMLDRHEQEASGTN